MEPTYVSANSRDAGVDVPKTISHLLTNGLQNASQYPRGNPLDILLHDGRCLAAVLVAEIMGIDFTFCNGLLRWAWISCRIVCPFTIKSACGSKYEKRSSNGTHSSLCLPACGQQRRLGAWQGLKVDLEA